MPSIENAAPIHTKYGNQIFGKFDSWKYRSFNGYYKYRCISWEIVILVRPITWDM